MDESKLLNHRYEILQQIGEGGFGETFLAKDTQMPSYRRCVIKQLKPVTDDSETYQLVQERFQREAATLEHLGTSHQQIPTLYAYFQENNYFYLVQEWINGETLSDYCVKKGLIEEKTLRQILVSLLSVLEYIHEQEIVHRDIKPDNIMLRQGSLEPVLLDFGAVKETMGTVLTQSHRPTHSMVVGTPGFMPSEQAVGRPVYNSDLYSLGLVGIYALTGKTPQEFATDMASGQILWRSDAGEISSELAQVLDCAIQCHPRDRYGSGKEMRLALEGSPQGQAPATIMSSAPQGNPQPATQISAPPTQAQNSSQPATQISQVPMTPSQANSNMGNQGGGGEWQKALIQGLVIGLSIMITLGVGAFFVVSQGGITELVESLEGDSTSSGDDDGDDSDESSEGSQASSEQGTNVTEDQLDNSSSDNSGNQSHASFDSEQAVEIVKEWQKAKTQIFAPPYSRQLGGQLLTGKAYQDSIRKPDGSESSVDWLQNNNAYYTYGSQIIGEYTNFQSRRNSASMDVVIAEQRTLCVNGRARGNNTAYDKRLVRYDFEYVQGQWKIANYETKDVIEKSSNPSPTCHI